MTNLTFANYDALTEYLVEATFAQVSAIKGAQLKRGFSNQSCSAYLTIEFLDADGDYLVDDEGEEVSLKLRFSNHGDRYGSDQTFRIDDMVEAVEVDGEYDHIEVADYRLDELVAEAVAAAGAFRGTFA